MASRGLLRTPPAQFPPNPVHGRPGGGSGSASAAASRGAVMADRGAKSRAVRSRLVATKTCSAAVSDVQFVGKTIGGNASVARALLMASTISPIQTESLYAADPQASRKLGDGAIFDKVSGF